MYGLFWVYRFPPKQLSGSSGLPAAMGLMGTTMGTLDRKKQEENGSSSRLLVLAVVGVVVIEVEEKKHG